MVFSSPRAHRTLVLLLKNKMEIEKNGLNFAVKWQQKDDFIINGVGFAWFVVLTAFK